MSRKPRRIDIKDVQPSPYEFEPGFIEPTPEAIAELEQAFRQAMEKDPFVKKIREVFDNLPEEELPPNRNPESGGLYHLDELLGITIPADKGPLERYDGSARAEESSAVSWKYGEGQALAELESYIRSTYSGHYADGGKEDIQAIDAIMAAGHGIGFCVGDIIKYSMRLGKKNGWNRMDVMKMLHYSILLLHAMQREGK